MKDPLAKLGREAKKIRGKATKIAVVERVAKLIQDTPGMVLCNNKGLTLSQATALRAKLRDNKVVFRVVKNTLLKRALEKAGHDPAILEDKLKLETVVAFGLEDPVTPAKLLAEYAKDNEKLEIKGGLLDGKALSKEQVISLSKLPGREELLAQMLGSMMAPVQNVVYALNQSVSKVVYAVDAYRRKKEEEAA